LCLEIPRLTIRALLRARRSGRRPAGTLCPIVLILFQQRSPRSEDVLE
jgi:hypothetical protein